MKRSATIIAALLFAGSLAQAQVTQVVSRNAVGYVKVTVTNGGFTLASVPFNDVGDTTPRTITEVMGDQLTGTDGIIIGSDFLLKWNATDQQYDLFWKANNGGNPEWRDQTSFFTPATNTLVPGDAFFIQNNQSTVQTVYVLGEVPDSFTTPTGTSTVSAVNGFNHISYMFPTDVAINDLALIPEPAASGFFGDQILRWNPGTQGYVAYFYDNTGSFTGGAGPGWVDFAAIGSKTPDVIKAGEGIFYNRAGAGTLVWNEAKPYTWP